MPRDKTTNIDERFENRSVLGYLTGRTLKAINRQLLFDSDLEPIRDNELYEVSTEGIHKVE